MSVLSKKSTFYLDPLIHSALRFKSDETFRSMSELVNEAIKELLSEDAKDLAAFDERAYEPLLTFEEMLKDLKRHGRI